MIRVVDPVGNEFLYSQADIEEQGLFRRGWRRKWEDKDDLRPSPAGSAGSQQKAMEDAMAARETRNARIHGADTAVASDIDELKRQIAELRSLLEAKPSEPATDSAPDFEKLTLEQLHAYATEHNVDLEGATLKSDVVAKLKAASA